MQAYTSTVVHNHPPRRRAEPPAALSISSSAASIVPSMLFASAPDSAIHGGPAAPAPALQGQRGGHRVTLTHLLWEGSPVSAAGCFQSKAVPAAPAPDLHASAHNAGLDWPPPITQRRKHGQRAVRARVGTGVWGPGPDQCSSKRLQAGARAGQLRGGGCSAAGR